MPAGVEGVSIDALVHILSYLDIADLLHVRQCSRSLGQVADGDQLWKPIALKVLEGKVTVRSGIPEKISAATGATAVCRKLLIDAVQDSKSCLISREDLAGSLWNFQFKASSPMQFPPDMPEFNVWFKEDGTLSDDNHPIVKTEYEWCFMEPAPSLRREGGYLVVDPDAPDPDFTVVRVSGRPPMRVFRHPRNWGIILSHHMALIANFQLPPRGSDPFIESIPEYFHPSLMMNSF